MTDDDREDDREDDGGDDAATKAQNEEEEVEEAKKVMEEIEEGDPPEKLEDWPGGKAKYQTYGGPDSEGGYEDGATSKLGPSNLRHHDDGSVTIDERTARLATPDDRAAGDAPLIARAVAREHGQRRHHPVAAQGAPELPG